MKKGFTLVELLAVIAILAILIIIALPNVMSMFNNAKKSTFETEVKEIITIAKQTFMKDSVLNASAKTYIKCKNNDCGTALDMNTRDNLEYYVELNGLGNIVKLYVTDGTYQYKYEGNGIKKDDVKDIQTVAELDKGIITIDSDYPTIDGKSIYSYAKLDTGINVNIKLKRIVGSYYSNKQHRSTDSKITKILRSTIEPSEDDKKSINIISANDSDYKVYAWKHGNYIYYYSEKDKIYLEGDMSYLFYGFSKATEIDLSSFDTSKSTNLSYLLGECGSLKNVDLSSFNTSRVVDMSYMFYNDKELTTLDLSNFNTSSVKNYKGMFYNCLKLSNLNISSFNTSNATDLSYMFYYCSNLSSIDAEKFSVNNAKDISYMFAGCENVKKLDVSSWNTSNVENMAYLFALCKKISTLDVSHFNTSKVKNMAGMFGMIYVSNLNVSNFETSQVENMSTMFTGNSAMKSLDVSNFDTSKVKDMSWMFAGCRELTTLDLSNFNTSNVTNMSNMFSSDSQVLNYGVSGATRMKIQNLKLSSFDTSNVETMKRMFYCNDMCAIMNNLDLRSFTLKDGVDLEYILYHYGLKEVIVNSNEIKEKLENSYKIRDTISVVVK